MERMLRNIAGNDSGGEDPVLERLRERRERFHHARHRLLEDTTFYLVLIPERLPIEETARSLQTLTENGIEVGALFVNRVLPESADEGEFMHARLAQQREYLAEIDSRFGERKVLRVEQDPRDVSNKEQLEKIARSLRQGLAAGA